MKIKRPSEKHFSDGLFTVKPFTGPEQQIRCRKTVSQRAFGQGVQADGYSAVCHGGTGWERAGYTAGERHERFVRAGPSEKYFSDGPARTNRSCRSPAV